MTEIEIFLQADKKKKNQCSGNSFHNRQGNTVFLLLLFFHGILELSHATP